MRRSLSERNSIVIAAITAVPTIVRTAVISAKSLPRLIGRGRPASARWTRPALLAGAVLLVAGASLAADFSVPVQLPDVGNGSQAKSIVIDATGAGLVAGEATTPSGRQVPVVWEVDLSDGSATGTPLPIPASAEGTANSIVIDATIAGVVAGTVTTANGVDHAVVWQQDIGGEWTAHPLPDVGNGSQAKSIVIDVVSAGVVAGEATTPGGRQVPVVWEVDLSDGSATAPPCPFPLAPREPLTASSSTPPPRAWWRARRPPPAGGRCRWFGRWTLVTTAPRRPPCAFPLAPREPLTASSSTPPPQAWWRVPSPLPTGSTTPLCGRRWRAAEGVGLADPGGGRNLCDFRRRETRACLKSGACERG